MNVFHAWTCQAVHLKMKQRAAAESSPSHCCSRKLCRAQLWKVLCLRSSSHANFCISGSTFQPPAAWYYVAARGLWWWGKRPGSMISNTDNDIIYILFISQCFNAAADWCSWLCLLICSTVRYFPCFQSGDQDVQEDGHPDCGCSQWCRLQRCESRPVHFQGAGELGC